MLEAALAGGTEVRVWYMGLTDPELHVARVAARVRKRGHAIPESAIRSRYDVSRRNLIRLLPSLKELRVFDNSTEADPHKSRAPEPRLLLHRAEGCILSVCRLPTVPQWAKPIVAAALSL